MQPLIANGVIYRECKGKYRYELLHEYCIHAPFTLQRPVNTKFISIGINGIMRIRRGYRWDGASGPAINTRNFVRGSLVHDVICQLTTDNILPEDYRKKGDTFLRQICREDGMSRIRAWWVYWAVSLYTYFT